MKQYEEPNHSDAHAEGASPRPPGGPSLTSDGQREEARLPSVAGAPATRGRPFAPGNPGRPRGSRNKTTLAVEAMIEGEAEAITRKVIDLAKDGDLFAAKLVFDRLAPPRKDRPITADLSDLDFSGDLASCLTSLMQATVRGELTPSEAKALADLAESCRRAVETTNLERRVQVLEAEDGK